MLLDLDRQEEGSLFYILVAYRSALVSVESFLANSFEPNDVNSTSPGGLGSQGSWLLYLLVQFDVSLIFIFAVQYW